MLSATTEGAHREVQAIPTCPAHLGHRRQPVPLRVESPSGFTLFFVRLLREGRDGIGPISTDPDSHVRVSNAQMLRPTVATER